MSFKLKHAMQLKVCIHTGTKSGIEGQCGDLQLDPEQHGFFGEHGHVAKHHIPGSRSGWPSTSRPWPWAWF